MSICVAWRWNQTFCLATDSRIIGGGDYPPNDFGIKLLQVPIRVFTPQVDGKTELLYRSTIGLAFAGSCYSGYLVKERMSEVLYNLQFIGNLPELTLERIIAAASIVYAHGLRMLKDAEMLWDTEMLIVGRCPASRITKAYAFSANPDATAEYKEILTKKPFDYFAIGAPSDQFAILMDDSLNGPPIRVHFAVLKNLKRVIDCKSIESVGGDVQYGEICDDGEFTLFGVMHYTNEDGLIRQRASLRGVDIEYLEPKDKFQALHVQYSYIDPYRPWNET